MPRKRPHLKSWERLELVERVEAYAKTMNTRRACREADVAESWYYYQTTKGGLGEKGDGREKARAEKAKAEADMKAAMPHTAEPPKDGEQLGQGWQGNRPMNYDINALMTIDDVKQRIAEHEKVIRELKLRLADLVLRGD